MVDERGKNCSDGEGEVGMTEREKSYNEICDDCGDDVLTIMVTGPDDGERVRKKLW